ncbi:MAG: flavin reductase FMN-binding protein [Marmoricola sp.]|nr:flavin reductase FMN-binding protein [Marmoricola sp.]
MTASFDRFIDGSDPSLVVVTAAVDGEQAGCLVGFHSQASIEPELYAVWLSRANRTMEVASRAERLAVHYLEHDQLWIAEHFGSLTGDEVDKFAGVDWAPGPHGLPLIDACPHHLVLERVELLDVGSADHVCWLGRVDTAVVDHGVGKPFRLADASELSPGHEADG